MSVEVVYKEALDTHPALQATLASVILVTAYLSLNLPRGSGALGLMLVFVITVSLFFNFRTLDISVSGGWLTVGYGFIRSRVRLSDILNAEAVRPPFWRYGGVGVRWGLDCSVGYIVDYRRGVRVTRREGMPVFFSTRNPEQLVRLLRRV